MQWLRVVVGMSYTEDEVQHALPLGKDYELPFTCINMFLETLKPFVKYLFRSSVIQSDAEHLTLDV